MILFYSLDYMTNEDFAACSRRFVIIIISSCEHCIFRPLVKVSTIQGSFFSQQNSLEATEENEWQKLLHLTGLGYQNKDLVTTTSSILFHQMNQHHQQKKWDTNDDTDRDPEECYYFTTLDNNELNNKTQTSSN